MIDFAKSPGDKNQDALFAAAIAYRKHPRNAQDLGGGVIPSIPYYTKEPRNQELVGVVNQQLPGVNPGLFGGPNSPVVAFGADGTCPAGQTPDALTCCARSGSIYFFFSRDRAPREFPSSLILFS